MKIAHCLPDHHWIDEMRSENPGDAAYIQQKYIAEGLRLRGHSVTWIAPQGFDNVCVCDTQVSYLASQTWTASNWFGLLRKVVWKIQQLFHIPYLNFFPNLLRYDACMQIFPSHNIVFERNGLYNSGVAMACKKLHMPYTMFFDADQIAELDFMGKPLKGLLRWRANTLLRDNLKIAKHIICVSEIARDHLMKTWQVPADKLVVLPNAVDVQRFKPDPDLRVQTRASLQLTDCPLVIFVGNFYRWHDVSILLKAFAVVLRTHPESRLLLVGDGVEREKMMRLSRDLMMEHAVIFTGYVSHAEVARYMNAADIAVVPVPKMDREMWLSPMKLFEYMASGKAIVATALGQVNDVIRDGDNGLLTPAGNEMAMAAAISKLIEDELLRTTLGKRAREDAIRKHSWERYLSNLENIFLESHQPERTRSVT
jgi:glycosyltransferase involved in cell wall biosynthesis